MEQFVLVCSGIYCLFICVCKHSPRAPFYWVSSSWRPPSLSMLSCCSVGPQWTAADSSPYCQHPQSPARNKHSLLLYSATASALHWSNPSLTVRPSTISHKLLFFSDYWFPLWSHCCTRAHNLINMAWETTSQHNLHDIRVISYMCVTGCLQHQGYQQHTASCRHTAHSLLHLTCP